MLAVTMIQKLFTVVIRGNGFETIQIRDGEAGPGYQGWGHTRVEGNYFYSLDVETEVISVKASHNTIRSNAFEACKGSVTLRYGDCNTVESNVFDGQNVDNSYGVRIFNRQWRF